MHLPEQFNMESSPSFVYSYDLLLKILSHCSLKSVDKSKIISKVCNDITYEPIFIQYHKNNTGTVYGYIIQSVYRNDYYYYFVSPDDVVYNKSKKSSMDLLDFLPRESKILASSDQGILCCVTRDKGYKQRFYVCKPTTRQARMLPNPKLRYMTDKVALVVLHSNPLRYKIVRLSRLQTRLFSNYCDYLCEIFDSKMWEWKQHRIELPTQVFICQNSVFAGSRFHWILSNNQVLVFDLDTETYTIFSLPTPVIDKEDNFRDIIELVKYKGKLGLIYEKFASDCEIWVLEDYTNHVWKKVKRINTEGAKKKEPYCVPHAVGLYTSNTALMKGPDYLFYNFEDSSVNVAKLDHRVTHPNDVFAFRSDLEPVDLRERN